MQGKREENNYMVIFNFYYMLIFNARFVCGRIFKFLHDYFNEHFLFDFRYDYFIEKT